MKAGETLRYLRVYLLWVSWMGWESPDPFSARRKPENNYAHTVDNRDRVSGCAGRQFGLVGVVVMEWIATALIWLGHHVPSLGQHIGYDAGAAWLRLGDWIIWMTF